MFANLIGAGAGVTTLQLTFAAFPDARPTPRPKPVIRAIQLSEAKVNDPVLRLEMKDGEIQEMRFAKAGAAGSPTSAVKPL